MSTSSTFNLAQLFPDDYQDITVDDVLVVPISGGTATSGTFGNITNHNTGRAISTLETPTMNILDGILTVSLGYASGTGQTGYFTPDGFAPSGSGSATVIPTCKVYLKAPSAGILSNERTVVWLSNGVQSAGKIFLKQITIPTGGVIYNETDNAVYNGNTSLGAWGTNIISAGTYNFYVNVPSASYVRIFLIY